MHPQPTSLRYPRPLLLPRLRLLSVPWALWVHLCCCQEVWREVPDAEEGIREDSEEELEDLPLYAVCCPDRDMIVCQSRLPEGNHANSLQIELGKCPKRRNQA